MSHRSSFDALMHEVCVGMGWCGSVVDGNARHVSDYIPESGDVTADQFVAWLFAADDVNFDEDHAKWQPHLRDLREAFVRHMGGDTVPAELLR